MFFMLPSFAVFRIYLIAAVLPAVILMVYIYRADTIEKEPPALLLRLVLAGVVAGLLAMILEYIGENLLAGVLSKNSPAYKIVLAFLIVAVTEEGAKFFLLKRRTWRDPNFNYRFDGVVYAVFVSLGFAAFENILYVSGYGLQVAISRAFLAIPGHMSFAVFMGAFYGRAKVCESYGDPEGVRRNLWRGYLAAVFLHGFYDACAMIGNVLSTVLFVAFIILMYLTVFRLVKKESANDRPI